jgi:hypothetical protein
MTDRLVQPSAPPSVRRVLTLLVAACIVPIVLVLAVLMINFYRKEEARLIDNTLNHARHISTAADREVRSTQLALQVLAGSHLLRERDLRAFHARISAIVDNCTSIASCLSIWMGASCCPLCVPTAARWRG